MKTIAAIITLITFLIAGSPMAVQGGHKVHVLNHVTAGFSIDSVARVDNAASLGVTTSFNYDTPFTPSDPVGAEMQAKGMHEIDAGFASELFYYECHRTHTVAPPPSGHPNNYCATDVNPAINSESALLVALDTKLQADAQNPLIAGYWVLDDRAYWDSGSAKIVLQDIHNHIQHYTPSYPAICGFGVEVTQPTVNLWLPGTALNYSNAGCDMIGIYSYIGTYSTPTSGSQFDFTMKSGFASAFNSLQQNGWNIYATPLIGIGQAFAGPYGGTSYQPGITNAQMITQAQAFCNAGATSMGWYAWDDSGFGSQTLTPMTSTEVQQGIVNSITTCKTIWHNSGGRMHSNGR